MELEKLKDTWRGFDQRMQQQEGLQSAIIRKILLDQSDKASNKMIGYSVVGLVIMMIGIPILLWGQGRARSFVEVLNMMVLIYLLCAIVTTMMLILKIHRADFSESVCAKIRKVERAYRFFRRIAIVSYVIGFLLFITVVIYLLTLEATFPLWFWGMLFALFAGGGVGAVFEYKRIFSRSFKIMLQNLKELEELEEVKP